VNKGERTRTQQMYKTDRCLKIIAIRKASPHIEKWQGVVQKKKKSGKVLEKEGHYKQ